MGSRTGVVIGSGPTGGWTGAVLCEQEGFCLGPCSLGYWASLGRKSTGAGAEAWFFLSKSNDSDNILVQQHQMKSLGGSVVLTLETNAALARV
ncbi:hypothetical protein Tco_1316733 [Tanacetum coccineum]